MSRAIQHPWPCHRMIHRNFFFPHSLHQIVLLSLCASGFVRKLQTCMNDPVPWAYWFCIFLIFIRWNWVIGLLLFCLEFFSKNLFFFFLLVSLSYCFDLALLLLNDPLDPFGNAKGVESSVFFSNSLSELPLPPFLDIFLIHWSNCHVPLDVHFHCL